jgi:hypothetical protein
MRNDKFRVSEWMEKTVRKIDHPGIYHTFVAHDDWCNTLKTGRGQDCNCDPDVEVVEDRGD